MKKIILASRSPRRQELMKLIASDFDCVASNIDESTVSDSNPILLVEQLSRLKASAVASSHCDSVVIGCDTMVILDTKAFGIPKDEDEAYTMLKSLSGRQHTVCTGVTLICNEKAKTDTFSVQTNVLFHELSDAEIYDYINTREPFDKAGAYGIQGYGALLVQKIDGDYFNVVGLPVSVLSRRLRQFMF